jgi:uncharacterized membrane protein YeiH
MRDLLFGRTVWWTQDPVELILCAVFMGMVTAIGGVLRDVLTNTQPMILCGELYTTAPLVGSLPTSMTILSSLYSTRKSGVFAPRFVFR